MIKKFILTFILVLSIMALNRNIVWESELNLWKDSTIKSSIKGRPYNGLCAYFLNNNMLDEAISNCKKCIELIRIKHEINEQEFITLYTSMLNLADAYKDKKDNKLIKESIDLYKTIIVLEPGIQFTCKAYNNLGVIYLRKGLMELAEKEFREAIKINNNFIEAHRNLVLVYLKNKMFEDAKKEYELILEIEPNDKNTIDALKFIKNRK